MGWWIGRKSAPGDVRPLVSAWLGTAQDEGFARAVEGMSLHVRASRETVCYHDGSWEMGVLRGSKLVIGDNQVVGGRAEALPSPPGEVGWMSKPGPRSGPSSACSASMD